jgi:hypothetical protein
MSRYYKVTLKRRAQGTTKTLNPKGSNKIQGVANAMNQTDVTHAIVAFGLFENPAMGENIWPLISQTYVDIGAP